MLERDGGGAGDFGWRSIFVGRIFFYENILEINLWNKKEVLTLRANIKLR